VAIPGKDMQNSEPMNIKKDVLTVRSNDVKGKETNLTHAYLKQRNKISV
jgi:hypothetical protein